MPTLNEAESRARKLAQLVGATPEDLPVFGGTGVEGRPRVEVRAGRLHYVLTERGTDTEKLSTSDLDELLYVVFQDVTFILASRHEVAHRMPNEDPRRQRFQKQEELMGRLEPNWQERLTAEHEGVLRKYPYDDAGGERAELSRQLRAQGHDPDAAWRLACERYPLPRGASDDVGPGGGR
jgi:hypothetical protein